MSKVASILVPLRCVCYVDAMHELMTSKLSTLDLHSWAWKKGTAPQKLTRSVVTHTTRMSDLCILCESCQHQYVLFPDQSSLTRPSQPHARDLRVVGASWSLHNAVICACVATESTEKAKGMSTCPMLTPYNSLSLCTTTLRALQSSWEREKVVLVFLMDKNLLLLTAKAWLKHSTVQGTVRLKATLTRS